MESTGNQQIQKLDENGRQEPGHNPYHLLAGNIISDTENQSKSISQFYPHPVAAKNKHDSFLDLSCNINVIISQ